MASDSDNVKEVLSIVDVVSSYLKLEHSGKYYKARCPFHSEKTASFVVTPERGIFHCFGCGKGGDMFTFVQEMEGLEFYEVLKMLAERAGVSLSTSSKKQRSEKDDLYEILELSSKFYETQLRKDNEVVHYLEERGLTKETMKQFRLGYAPDEWEALVGRLRNKGYKDQKIAATGMTSEGKRGYIDRFRSRIMFPITDVQGRIIGFSGRIFIRENETDDPPDYKVNTGKYINTPETELYDKSRVLYGIDQAKRGMMKQNRCVLVEGQMDCLLSHQSGVSETVAASGTALTDAQMTIIKRFTDILVMALDADEAGINALHRSVMLAYQNEMELLVVELPEDKDPADIVESDGEEKWQEYVDNSVPYLSFELSYLKRTYTDSHQLWQHITSSVFPVLVYLTSSIKQDYALQEIADTLELSPDAVRQDFARFAKNQKTESNKESTPGNEQKATPKALPRKEQLVESIFELLLWAEEQGHTWVVTSTNGVKEVLGDEQYQVYENRYKNDYNQLMFSAEQKYSNYDTETLKEEFNELVTHLKLELLEAKQRQLHQELRKKEEEGDQEAIGKVLEEYQQISRQIHGKRADIDPSV